jgi:hypothetical protein
MHVGERAARADGEAVGGVPAPAGGPEPAVGPVAHLETVDDVVAGSPGPSGGSRRPRTSGARPPGEGGRTTTGTRRGSPFLRAPSAGDPARRCASTTPSSCPHVGAKASGPAAPQHGDAAGTGLAWHAGPSARASPQATCQAPRQESGGGSAAFSPSPRMWNGTQGLAPSTAPDRPRRSPPGALPGSGRGGGLRDGSQPARRSLFSNSRSVAPMVVRKSPRNFSKRPTSSEAAGRTVPPTS